MCLPKDMVTPCDLFAQVPYTAQLIEDLRGEHKEHSKSWRTVTVWGIQVLRQLQTMVTACRVKKERAGDMQKGEEVGEGDYCDLQASSGLLQVLCFHECSKKTKPLNCSSGTGVKFTLLPEQALWLGVLAYGQWPG